MASIWILFFSYEHDSRSNTHQSELFSRVTALKCCFICRLFRIIRYNNCYDIAISGRKHVYCLNSRLDKNILLRNCICFHVLSSSKTCSCKLFITLTLLRIMNLLVQNVFMKRRISRFESLFQINPVHVITPYGLVIPLNIIFPVTPQSEKWLFPYFLICTC